ncbi:isochorismate synthase [Conservatibacter flavescens]|uniref:Isochorismate synthase MenF n=1 Tax=Conservatibacter flavescens TaxID=28161 RepID=A0A2M8S473_9PAST|nr:isochorismate synthase [Conservatibacter flavescens]PJG85945.1 isochorismate synthase [Conservatibacter flavescens]
MDNLQSLKRQVEQCLLTHQPNPQETISMYQFHVDFYGHLLSWLKAQSTYPQFYFNLRDSAEKLCAIGKVRSFSEVFSANQFVQQSGFTLIGGLTFDGASCFYLPRLLFQQQQNRLTLSVFIDNQVAFSEEKAAIAPLLDNLARYMAFDDIHSNRLQLIDQAHNQAAWCNMVQSALQALQHTELNKVVLANASDFQCIPALNAKDFLRESELVNTHCYHFLFAQDAERCFVGSSPECLYQRQDNHLITEALAGTAFVHHDTQQNQQQADWLLHDSKNQYENWLVVEGICQNLKHYAQNIDVSPLSIKQLRQVQHLYRQIFVELAPHIGDDRCLQAIHPTAAISGLPQQIAIDFIQKTEKFDRTWYAGTLGFISPQRAEFCVTIRSAIIEHNKIRVFAGAGIVEGSDPLLEWQEIERKAMGLISLLQSTTTQ